MARKGLVHHQGGPWGPAGSLAVDRWGRQVFRSRTAGLYRAPYLEEIGKMSLHQPTLVLFSWLSTSQKSDLSELATSRTPASPDISVVLRPPASRVWPPAPPTALAHSLLPLLFPQLLDLDTRWEVAGGTSQVAGP